MANSTTNMHSFNVDHPRPGGHYRDKPEPGERGRSASPGMERPMDATISTKSRLVFRRCEP